MNTLERYMLKREIELKWSEADKAYVVTKDGGLLYISANKEECELYIKQELIDNDEYLQEYLFGV